MIYVDWLIYKGIWQPLFSHPLQRIFSKKHRQDMFIPLEIGYKRLYHKLQLQRHTTFWRLTWHLPYLTCPIHMMRSLNSA